MKNKNGPTRRHSQPGFTGRLAHTQHQRKVSDLEARHTLGNREGGKLAIILSDSNTPTTWAGEAPNLHAIDLAENVTAAILRV